MNNVLIITYYWPPSGGAGVQRMLKFVKYLHLLGVKITVITVDPLMASYQLTDDSFISDIPDEINVIKTKTFEPFNLYKSLGSKKEIPHSGFANETNPGFFQKASRFVRGNFFIPDARRGWNYYAYREAIKVIKNNKIDAIITSSPPHSSQLIGLKLKERYDIPWIADLRDPWTDIYYYKQMLHTFVAKWIDNKYERNVLEKSDAVLVVSKFIKNMFLTKSEKLDFNKINVLPNGFDADDFSETSKPPSDKFLITYTGTFADIYDIDSLLEALQMLLQKHPEAPVELNFTGKTTGSLSDKIKKYNLDKITTFKEYVPHKESVAIILKSTILLLVIPKMDKNEGILTGKLFEYLVARKPILCIGPKHGDAAEIITECDAGTTFDYHETTLIYDFLLQNYLKWKINPDLDLQNDKNNKYSRKQLSLELYNILNNICK